MDLRTFGKFGPGDIAQFAPVMCYELIGQAFTFEMDDGQDYALQFLDKNTLQWNFGGDTPKTASGYLCAKADETTYLVSYELGGAARTNHTFVIDLENWLVTRIFSQIGENPRVPYLITPRYEFGAIKRDGAPYKTYPRHGFSSDVIGNVVQWNYGGMETVHVYYCANYYRITYPPKKAGSQMFSEAMAKLPSSDEPTVHIKIKEGMYLFSLTERNMELILGGEMPFRSNTMCFIQDYRNMYQIGRAFGTTQFDKTEDKQLHILFGAFGKILEPDGIEEYIQKLLTDPNPYLA